MDNLTHSLVGVALSRVFFKDKAPLATTMLVLAANAPDVDAFVAGRGIDYLAWHRNLTHSLLFLPVWIAIVALVWRSLARLRQRRGQTWNRERGAWQSAPENQALKELGAAATRSGPGLPNPVPWRLALWAGFLGVGSHLLLDWTNSYGIRLFSPLSMRWFALDWMPILDPWLWLILLVFLLLPMVLGLVSREMGARPNRHRTGAAVALIAMLAWWGFRAEMHARALLAVKRGPIPAAAGRGSAAIPEFSNPLFWRGIVSLPDRYYVGEVDSPEESWQKAPQIVYKTEPTPAMQAAERSRSGRIFLDFARFPLAGALHTGDLTEVWITDLRFGYHGAPPRMGLRVWLDPKLHVVRSRFGFSRPGVRPG